MTREEFIALAIEKHGQKFDYSKIPTNFKLSTKVEIICPIHGSFTQIAGDHIIRGYGCKKCRTPSSMSTEEILRIHYDKFETVKFISRHKNDITVECEHLQYTIPIPQFLQGRTKCKHCADKKRGKKTFDFDKFVKEANEVHNSKYKYYNEYDDNGRMKIECPEHGIFWQRPRPHHILHEQGCPECGKLKQSNSSIENHKEQFIDRAMKIHGDYYDYSLVEYTGSMNKVTIICPKHGGFTQLANNHLQGHGCRKCGFGNSQIETVISSWFVDIFAGNDRTFIKPKELDLVSHEHKLAVEINGVYWHSTKYKDKNYHIDKTNAVEEKGYQLLHFWDYEISDKPDLVRSMIASKLGLNNVIYARKCSIVIVEPAQARLFESANHIQGTATGESIRYGLMYDNNLVALMTFGKSRFDKKYDWELIRFCCLSGYNVIGGASKLFKHFLKHHSGNIMSYANRRISNGKLYNKLGFNEVSRTPPNYFWFKSGKILSRQKCQKHKLNDLLEDKYYDHETEQQNMERNGYVQCFDCGNIKFEFIRK